MIKSNNEKVIMELIIAGTIISIIAVISFIIGIVALYIIRQRNKEIDHLFSEIEDIKQFLNID